MSTDAIVLLKDDHKRVAKLFGEYEKKATSEARKRAIVTEVLEELTVHTHLENVIFYPEIVAAIPDLKDHILESYEEHHVVDVLASELAAMDPGEERYAPKFTVLMENVRHHVKEEEEDWFPQVRREISRADLREMGARMLEEKKSAPRKPVPPKEIKREIDEITS